MPMERGSPGIDPGRPEPAPADGVRRAAAGAGRRPVPAVVGPCVPFPRHPALAALLPCLLLVLLSASPAAGQRLPASPPLPSDHWALDALERLAAEGLLHGVWLPGRRPVPEAVAQAALDSAAARGGRRESPLAGFAADAAARLWAERGGTDPGWAPPPWVTATAGSGRSDADLGLATRALLQPYRSLSVMATQELRVRRSGPPSDSLLAASLAWAVGPLQLGLARGGHVLGPGAGGSGGLILDDAAALDAAVLETAGPVRLPGLLAALGPLDAGLAVTRIRAVTVDTTGTDPWMLAGRVAVAPHPRLLLGLSRVITWVADWHGERLAARDAAYMVIGKHTVFDDQKMALDVTLRLTLLGLPVTLYGELGFEDSAGAYSEDPGVLAGVLLPRLPGATPASLRWEYTAFGGPACWAPDCGQRRSWFLHPGSRRLHATPDGTPLGHPLGGYGRQHRATLAFWPARPDLRVALTGAVLQRLPGNLLYTGDDSFEGSAALALDWWPAPGWEVGIRGEAGPRESYRAGLRARITGW